MFFPCNTNVVVSLILNYLCFMEHRPVVFFDGVCNLCNRSVQFIIKHDEAGKFMFASLQSDYAQKELGVAFNPEARAESLKLLENGKLYVRSSAALRIARRLSGAWSILFVFYIIPAFIRDFFYNLVSKNRYRIWGRTAHCQIPDQHTKERFL